MTVNGWIQILLYMAIIFAITKPLGSYMYRVFEGDRQPLPRLFGAIERLLYKLCGVDPKQQQDWKQYTRSDARVQRNHVAGDLRHRAAATYFAVESAEFWHRCPRISRLTRRRALRRIPTGRRTAASRR